MRVVLMGLVAVWVCGAACSPVQALSQCLGDGNGDNEVTIDELVKAVNRSLNGCQDDGICNPLPAEVAQCTASLATCNTDLATCRSGTGTPADVLSGETFSSSNGLGLTGTMPNNGAVHITPGTAAQTIPAGYHNGSGTVAGDANLVSSNIKSGTSIFAVAGSPTVVDTTGATATGSDLASGKTAYVNGNLVTGTLAVGEMQPPAQLLKTGQTTCYNPFSVAIPCAGTGQDAELQKGIGQAYVDNGDGTISDTQTGLMWEKKDNNNIGGIHDRDDQYTFDQAFSVFIAALNNRCGDETTDCTAGGDASCTEIGTGKCGFAGHRDWRIPNRRELESIEDLGLANPGINAVFDSGLKCVPGCKSTGADACSCTYSGWTWTSTSYTWAPNYAWSVDFYYGEVNYMSKAFGENVRAVRGDG